MTIHSYEKSLYCENQPIQSLTILSKGDVIKSVNVNVDGSVTCAANKRKINKNKDHKSPFRVPDNMKMMSRITENKIFTKKPEIFSSFSLAENLYKANSDDFRSVKKSLRKVKKSVLTLPNDSPPFPQVCTASDIMNEYSLKSDEHFKSNIKKRVLKSNKKKIRTRNMDNVFYDRDAKFCSQMNINILDCSSTDTIKYQGDGMKVSSRISHNLGDDKELKPHDVWKVLRKINRFHFRPSPRISDEESIVTRKKKIFKQKRNLKSDESVIETCRTEEFAFISSIEVDSRTTSLSQTSSFDRVTVIEQDGINHVIDNFDKHAYSVNKGKNNKTQKTTQKLKKKGLKNLSPRQIWTEEDHTHLPLNRKPHSGINKLNKNKESVMDVNDDSKQLVTSSSVLNTERTLQTTTLSNVCEDKIGYDNRSSGNLMETALIQQNGNNVFVHSGNSGSSKAAGNDFHKETLKRDLNSTSKLLFSRNLNDIKLTCSLSTQRNERKPRLVTTMPSSVPPKLTQTEIKRRLSRIKFPLVILGKDQVRSTLEVRSHEYVQFSGLDRKIWPFMVDWKNQENKNHLDVCTPYTMHIKSDLKVDKKFKNLTNYKKPTNSYSRPTAFYKNKDDIKGSEAIFNTNKEVPQNNKMTCETQLPTKPRFVKQITEKVVDIIYKKSCNTLANRRLKLNDQGKTTKCEIENVKKNYINNKYMNVGTESNSKFNLLSNFSNSRGPSPQLKKPLSIKYPWAKAKQGSDFIANVIRKLNNGVYHIGVNNKPTKYNFQKDYGNYNNELHDFKEYKEIASQTTSKFVFGNLPNTQYEELTPKLIIPKTNDPFKIIPGFDNIVPCLEIKSLNAKQISIKHCLENVIVQFDVIIPVESSQAAYNKDLSSCAPIFVKKNSMTKIFKCETTIINAILPAELCNIIPKMMHHIMEINKPATFTESILPNMPLKPDLVYKDPDCLNNFENLYSLIHMEMSPAIKLILHGMFSRRSTIALKGSVKNSKFVVEKVPDIKLTNISKVSLKTLLFNSFHIHPSLKIKLPNFNQTSIPPIDNKPTPSPCTSLQLYSKCDKTLMTPYKFNIIHTLENIIAFNNNIVNMPRNICLQNNEKNNTVSLKFSNDMAHQTIVSFKVDDNMGINFLYTACLNTIKYELPNKKAKQITFLELDTEKSKIKDIKENTKSAFLESHTEKSMFNYVKQDTKGINSTKVKLRNKCKSTSNISNAKCFTPLSKIANIDDFFQILGSGKSLSSVFDGYSAKKIMTSILEMQNWISDISSKQALLVLLLTNKKDTPNLVRFRPVLLQGIAVNRITRATELDMEIEVIERENFNNFIQIEEIHCSSTFVQNYDNLLEELYWIAKTTASDYQKPFDESSERLLKSLLEKRKNSNPNYLRVMARYVGLGLLKHTSKKF